MALMTFKELVKKTAPDFIEKLGEVVVINSSFEGLKSIYAIFPLMDSEPVIDPYTQEPTTPEPQAMVATEDVPNIRHKDTFLIENITYEITKVDDKHDGTTVLTLHKIRED